MSQSKSWNTQKAEVQRAIIVVTSGWIYAGDVEEACGRIRLRRAVWVFGWQRVGFAEVIKNPMRDGIDIRPMPEGPEGIDLDIPMHSEIYRVPVVSDWGIRK